MHERYDRNIRLFGEEGQETLRQIKVAVVGVGGLGTHVVQQLAHLGVGHISLIDSEELDTTNLNRYVGTRPDDVGKPKVDIAAQNITNMDLGIEVKAIFDSLVSKKAFDAIKEADYVFGCLDSEGARLILNELCLAYKRPYFDLLQKYFQVPHPAMGGEYALCPILGVASTA